MKTAVQTREKRRGGPLSMLDNVIASHVSQSCWLLACLGMAAVQATLLAQGWRLNQHALQVACIAGSWSLGSVVGLRLRHALRRIIGAAVAPLWGMGGLCCILCWWMEIAPRIGMSSAREGGSLLPGTFVLGTVALVMGMSSTCWLGARRPWPAIGEQVSLTRNLVCLTLGLCVAWLWPAQSGYIAALLVVPLFALDLVPASLCPFPIGDGMAETLIERNLGDPAAWFPLRVDAGQSVRWWLRSLARRGMLLPTVLASGLSVVIGALWYTVPTPFAAHLARTHQGATLVWMATAQLVALGVGWYLCERLRGMVGRPDRLIPPRYYRRCVYLAGLAVFLLASSLILLGLPWLQAPGWLAGSLALYTLGGGAWNILLPRLQPSLSIAASAQRHLSLPTGRFGFGESGRHAFIRAWEEEGTHWLACWEAGLTAIGAPLFGLLIDGTSFDDTLVLIGLSLLLLFPLALLILRRLPGLSRASQYDAGQSVM
jgi:hypothetical protein